MQFLLSSKLPLNRIYRITTSIYFFISGLCFSTWASRIADIQVHLGLNNAGLGRVLFALPAGLIVSLPLSGWLVTKFSSKLMMLVGSLFYAILLCLLGYCDHTWQLLIVLFFFGLFGNLLNIAMNTNAVSTEAVYGRSIMASFHGLWSLAGFVGAFTGTLMIANHIRPLFHFAVIAVLLVFVTIVFYRFLSDTDIRHDKDHPVFVLPDKRLMNLGLIALCFMVCEGSMFDWSIIYFKKEVTSIGSNATFGYVAFICSMTIGRFSGDWLAGKAGVKQVLQVSGVVVTIGLLIAIFFPYLLSATIGFLLVGFGVSTVVPLVYSLAGRSGTMSAGAALATVTSIGYFGFLFGPPVIGFIGQTAGLRYSFLLITCLGFCASLLSNRLKI